jgi:multidrug resistance efflux pump
MRHEVIFDLADCTTFRQTLLARPPAIVHGTALLLAALVATAVAWSALTQADLVVRARGRVRPVSAPKKIFNAARGEVLSASVGGRVVESNAREGDEVHRGDVLIRLDTSRIDSDIARQRQTLRAAEEELAGLDQLAALMKSQYEAVRAKAEAELSQARDEVRREKEARESDLRLAQVEANAASDEEAALRKLVARRASSAADLIRAVVKSREASERLTKARLPVDEGKVEVLRRSLDLAARDDAVRREELTQRRNAKRAEAESIRIGLTALELEREQAVIVVPIDGVVTSCEVKVGDILERGRPVAEIAEQAGFRFEATVAAADVGHLTLGMPARVKLDAYDYQKYGTLHGLVCFLSPDSGPAEGGKAPTYTVRIALDGDEVGRGESRGRIKLGMSGQAEIISGRESLLSLLSRRVRRSISLG